MTTVKLFLSSTYRDLKGHREVVLRQLRRIDGLQVICMEDFTATDGHSKDVCLGKLDDCDVYVGMFAWFYGSTPPGEETSLTEHEYLAARAKSMPRLLFLADDDTCPTTERLREPAKKYKRLKALRERILQDRVVDFFGSPDKLSASVLVAVMNWLIRHRVATGEAPASLHQLPSDIPDFTGRAAELDTLLTALTRDNGNAAVVTAIRGMGGVGKTALAVHAARRLVARYPDAQIVVNLQGYGDAEPLKPMDALAKVVQAFEPAFKPVDDLGQMTAHHRSVLDGKRALILLDNAPAGADLRALVPPPPCGLIVTARDRVAVDGATPIALGLLARSESVALLRKASCRTDVTDAEWERLAALCGDLPLALRVAGSFLEEAINQTATNYLAALADERTRLDALRLDDLPDRDVGAVLGLSARALVRRDAKAAARWQMLTVFPADFDENAAAAVWAIEPPEARKTLTALLGSALLLFDTDERRYRLHDLLRPVARQAFFLAGGTREQAGGDDRLWQAAVRHARHFTDVLGKADALFLKGNDGVLAGLRVYDREAQNVFAAASWAMQNRDRDADATTVAAWLPDQGSFVLDLRLHQRQLIAWLDSGRDAARALGHRPLEAAHVGNRGLAYAALGETRHAIEDYEQALAIAREIGDRRGEGNQLGNLGLAYADLGETRRAIDCAEKALAIAREIGDRRGESNRLGNLGLAYADMGETRRAIEHHEQALAISREIGDHRGEGSDLCNLGNAYAALGETRRAIEYYEQALVIAREIGDRRGEGIRLANLGNAYAALSEIRRAIEHYEQALAIAREIGDRRGEGNRLGNLGNAYADLGETHRAIDLGEVALAIFQEIESPNAATMQTLLNKWRGH